VLTRRAILKGLGAFGAGTVGLVGYAFGVEPRYVRVTRYAIAPPRWPAGLELRLAAIADLHACDPWMAPHHIEEIVATANGLAADAIVLLGDYKAGFRLPHRALRDREWTTPLAGLRAPLGVHAILGNHDWWDDRAAQRRGRGPVRIRRALEDAGLPVYENDAARLVKQGRPFWIAGLGDQWAIWYGQDRRGPGKRWNYRGMHDLAGTLAKVTDEAPVILLAHEPDIFPEVPERVALTLSGHTHGGQVNLLGYRPFIPSRFGTRYAHGHIVERRPGAAAAGVGAEPRHLIVSAGLGCSGVPVRLGAPPEIVVVDVGARRAWTL
jgi:hypothetical protein